MSQAVSSYKHLLQNEAARKVLQDYFEFLEHEATDKLDQLACAALMDETKKFAATMQLGKRNFIQEFLFEISKFNRSE